jgi:hypothetical protein
LLDNVDEGTVRPLLRNLQVEMRYRVQWTARLESMGWVHFMDPLRPEYSAATEEMLKQLDSCSAESLESQLREDQRSDNGDNETAPLSRNPSRLYLWLARSVAMLR